MKKFDVVIIGGGAAGLASAIEAARNSDNKKIAIIDRMPRVGKKILATGNGRCNLSNANITYNDYYGDKEFTEYALGKYNVKNTLEFFKTLGLMTVTEDEGRIYPMSRQATAVLDALRFECENLGVEIICDTKVNTLKKCGDKFEISDDIISEKVIIATGGKSAPEQGSDGSGYELLKQMGHRILPVYPSLVQLKCSDYPKQLKGVRANADIKLNCGGKYTHTEIGEIQFTDSGISGIAVMQLSRFASENLTMKKGKIIAEMDLVTSQSRETLIEFIVDRKNHNGQLPCENLLTGIVPKLLGQVIIKQAGVPLNQPVKTLNDDMIKNIAGILKCFTLEIVDTNGFKNSQVTAGGADTSEFDSNTMQSKKVKGLYAAGEVLNVDGKCGGYNLQWAWSSGRLAGLSAVK